MTTRRRALDPDALTMDAIRRGVLADAPVTVLGFARSGIALARFLADAGARVTVYDGRPADELSASIEALEDRSVDLELGPDVEPSTTWADAVLVTTSPSINRDYPTTEPRLRAALRELVERRSRGDKTAPALISEPDLFLRLCTVPTVGVTGTKGKTTSASLTAAVLAADQSHPVVLGGNIGVPILDRLTELTPQHRVVYELSELQLPTLSRGTTVALYTNVTSDHLDRHGSLEEYRRVKRILADRVDPHGALVLNAEDEVVASYAESAGAPVVMYRRGDPPRGGVGVVDGWIVAADVPRVAAADDSDGSGDGVSFVMPVGELGIPGAHNVSNALGAVAVGLLFGVPPDAIRAAAAAFTGVEHRLEPVATVDGVRFVNDSQGTQPDAVIAALRAFDPPIVLIAGGRDKGVDLDELVAVAGERLAAAVMIGESGPDLGRRFAAAGVRRVESAATMGAAVQRADALAREELAAGDRAAGSATVLLSPAATSFDMFKDYAARGQAFKDAVADLIRARAGSGR